MKEQVFVYIPYMTACKEMKVCRYQDRHNVKYEEGFFIVVKILKKGMSNPNVSVKVRSKTMEGANAKIF